jgi:exopolysaccharide production protein ExoY
MAQPENAMRAHQPAVAHQNPLDSSGVSSPIVAPIHVFFRKRVAESGAFRFHLRAKRLFDLAASSLLIVLLLPMFLLCYLAVRLTSRGPFIFSQPRWGLEGQRFFCHKMRTMDMDKARAVESLQSSADRERGILLKMRRDPRVTRVGNLLRRSSLDELPQLFNVLVGDMSMVGPRPLMIHMMSGLPEIREARSVVRPGITGLWQIRNRANNTSVLNMIDDDAEYIANLSLWLDLRILLATPSAVLFTDGAH